MILSLQFLPVTKLKQKPNVKYKATGENQEFADLIDRYWYVFDDAGYATISKLSDYKEEKGKLLTIYDQKKVDKDEFIYLPTIYRNGGYNSAVIAVSESRYIENEDGSFRGLQYFAEIAQNDYPCANCVFVMTDGCIVVEYISKRYISTKYKDMVKNGRIIGFDQKEYSKYLKSMDQNDNEEVVKKYNEEFKKMIKSVKMMKKEIG